jgi:hypothetical protein
MAEKGRQMRIWQEADQPLSWPLYDGKSSLDRPAWVVSLSRLYLLMLGLRSSKHSLLEMDLNKESFIAFA